VSWSARDRTGDNYVDDEGKREERGEVLTAREMLTRVEGGEVR